MKILAMMKWRSPEAQAEYDRAVFLFDCAERANAKGFFDLTEDIARGAIQCFNAAKAAEHALTCGAGIAVGPAPPGSVRQLNTPPRE